MDARSSIATEFFTKLSSWADPNGTIMLPGQLRFWQPGNKGDKVIDIRQDLHFFGPPPKAIAPQEDTNEIMQDLPETVYCYYGVSKDCPSPDSITF